MPSMYKPHNLEARGWPFKSLLIILGGKLSEKNMCALVHTRVQLVTSKPSDVGP